MLKIVEVWQLKHRPIVLLKQNTLVSCRLMVCNGCSLANAAPVFVNANSRHRFITGARPSVCWRNSELIEHANIELCKSQSFRAYGWSKRQSIFVPGLNAIDGIDTWHNLWRYIAVCVFVCVWLFLSQCVAGFSWCFFCGVMLRHVVVLLPDMKWHDMTWNDMNWHELTWIDMNWHETTLIAPSQRITWYKLQPNDKWQKNMSKSQTSHRHKKKLTTISPCVSWSKVGYWGMVINPLGLIWWDDHTMFCFESWYMWQMRINQDGAWTALLSLFHATNSTRCNVDWSIKSW